MFEKTEVKIELDEELKVKEVEVKNKDTMKAIISPIDMMMGILFLAAMQLAFKYGIIYRWRG